MIEPEYSFFFDLSGGQNDTVSVLKVAPNEASELRNINLERDGAASKRKGATKESGSPIAAGHQCGMLLEFKPTSGSAEIIGAWGDKVAKFDRVLGTFTNLATGLLNNAIVVPVAYRNLLYMMNNSDNAMVYYSGAGSSPYIFRPGAPQPTALTDGGDISGSVGSVGHKFKVRIRYVNIISDNFVGEPYPEAGLEITLGASQGRRITLPTYPNTATPFDYRITKILVERTTAGATSGGTFYIDGYANNGDASYDITGDNTTLQQNDIAPDLDAREPMPKLWPFIAHNNRIVGIEDGDLGKAVWSEIDEFGLLPDVFPALNYQYLDVADYLDAPVAMGVLGQNIIVYCGRSIHMLHIDSGGNSYTRKLMDHELGIPSPRALVSLPNGHLVWTYNGPYFYDGRNLVFIGERIEDTLRTLNKAQLSQIYAVHRAQEHRRQIKFVMPEASSRNDFAAVYHYRRQTLNPEGFPTAHAWTFHDGFYAKSGCMATGTTFKKEEISGDYDGDVYQEDDGDNDPRKSGNEIHGTVRTAWLDMDEPHMEKFFTDLWVWVECDDQITLTVKWEGTFGDKPSETGSVTFTPGGSVFGTGVFGTAVFGGKEVMVLHTQLAKDGVGAYGRYLRLTFSNTNDDEFFSVLGFCVKWQPERDRDDAIE